MNFRNPIAILALLAIAGAGVAQEVEEESNEIPEEITVYGQKTLLNLKMRVYRAEEDFFKLFNELNEDDQYDIFCEKIARVGSRIKRRTCWSPFEREIDEEQTRRSFESGSAMLGMRNEGLIRHKRLEQAKMLVEMVRENPALQKKYAAYAKAGARFDAEREARCADSFFCRGPGAGEAAEEAAAEPPKAAE